MGITTWLCHYRVLSGDEGHSYSLLNQRKWSNIIKTFSPCCWNSANTVRVKKMYFQCNFKFMNICLNIKILKYFLNVLLLNFIATGYIYMMYRRKNSWNRKCMTHFDWTRMPSSSLFHASTSISSPCAVLF